MYISDMNHGNWCACHSCNNEIKEKHIKPNREKTVLSSHEQEQLNRIEKKLDELLNKDKVDIDIDYEYENEDCGHEECDPFNCNLLFNDFPDLRIK